MLMKNMYMPSLAATWKNAKQRYALVKITNQNMIKNLLQCICQEDLLQNNSLLALALKAHLHMESKCHLIRI